MTVPTGLPVGATSIAARTTGYELAIDSSGKASIKAAANDIADLATLAGAVSGGKTAVKAASGDFVAGAIVDLATLLTLAGTSADANTVASLMGRLTKIRDLLDTTLPVNLSQLSGSAISNTNPLPAQDIEQPDYIALTTPPAATTAGSDTPLTFASQVNRVILQNKTGASVYFAFGATASPGSLELAADALLVYPKKCTVLHLYTVAAQNINGSADGNIVVMGAM